MPHPEPTEKDIKNLNWLCNLGGKVKAKFILALYEEQEELLKYINAKCRIKDLDTREDIEYFMKENDIIIKILIKEISCTGTKHAKYLLRKAKKETNYKKPKFFKEPKF